MKTTTLTISAHPLQKERGANRETNWVKKKKKKFRWRERERKGERKEREASETNVLPALAWQSRHWIQRWEMRSRCTYFSTLHLYSVSSWGNCYSDKIQFEKVKIKNKINFPQPESQSLPFALCSRPLFAEPQKALEWTGGDLFFPFVTRANCNVRRRILHAILRRAQGKIWTRISWIWIATWWQTPLRQQQQLQKWHYDQERGLC